MTKFELAYKHVQLQARSQNACKRSCGGGLRGGLTGIQ